MINLIEELKAKMEAATVADCDLDQMPSQDAEFLFLAYHLMPTLLEAMGALDNLVGCVEQHAMSDDPEVVEELADAIAALHKLYGEALTSKTRRVCPIN